MGKVKKAIMMLEYLNSGNKYTVKELANKLGVSERMIKYYKKELEESGIFIESFMGPNGGYFLLNSIKPYNTINKYDVQLLNKVYNNTENNDDKINNVFLISEERAKFFVDINIKNDITINKLNEVIKNKDRIEILYKGVDGNLTKRFIYPVQLFTYKDEYYVTAFCELRKDIRHFELKNIISIL